MIVQHKVKLLDPGTILTLGTALYFQPQFSSQATGTLKSIQLNIYGKYNVIN